MSEQQEQYKLCDAPGAYERDAATGMLERAHTEMHDLDARGASRLDPSRLEAEWAYRRALDMRDGGVEELHSLRDATLQQTRTALRRAREVARQRSEELRTLECADESSEEELDAAALRSWEAELDVAGLERIADRRAEVERGIEL